MQNAIVYLIGHYGVGKLTIAKELSSLTGAKMFDNHLANNVIFSLIREDGSSEIPRAAWDLIMTIRRQALKAIVEISQPSASFVLTNALLQNDPLDQEAFDDVARAADARGSTFVPVILTASDAAHAVRIPAPERETGMKLTNPEIAADVRRNNPLLAVSHANRLDLDTTQTSAAVSAALIVDHIRKLTSNSQMA